MILGRERAELMNFCLEACNRSYDTGTRTLHNGTDDLVGGCNSTQERNPPLGIHRNTLRNKIP